MSRFALNGGSAAHGHQTRILSRAVKRALRCAKGSGEGAQIIFARTAVDTMVTLGAGPSYWVLLDRNVGDLLPLGQELAEKLDHGLKVWISNGE
jgi:hypothetical protein